MYVWTYRHATRGLRRARVNVIIFKVDITITPDNLISRSRLNGSPGNPVPT